MRSTFGTKKEMNMERFVMTLAILALANNVFAEDRSNFVSNLNAGMQQTLVVYGTSLTAGGAWVGQLQKALNERYPGQATLINSGKGGMWSKWGLDNLDTRVIEKKPDTILIEFAINDAFLEYKTSVAEARINLTNMIDRILASKSETEIILMTMNPPIGVHLDRRPMIKDYYQMYRDVAKERKLKLIDHYGNWESIMEKDRALFDKYVPDGIHPGPEGCTQVITPAILNGLGIKAELSGGGDGKPAPQP
jgi:lysophospholipase L1-like esterase